jgi:hypothetical protein
VTDAEVQNFIDQECAFINGRICTLYQTPIDEILSPISFMILKRINIFLASDRVRHVLYVKTGIDNKDQDSKGLHSLSRNPRQDLKDIQSGMLKLCDAISLDDCIGFDTAPEAGTCCDLQFDVKKQQW